MFRATNPPAKGESTKLPKLFLTFITNIRQGVARAYENGKRFDDYPADSPSFSDLLRNLRRAPPDRRRYLRITRTLYDAR